MTFDSAAWRVSGCGGIGEGTYQMDESVCELRLIISTVREGDLYV